MFDNFRQVILARRRRDRSIRLAGRSGRGSGRGRRFDRLDGITASSPDDRRSAAGLV